MVTHECLITYDREAYISKAFISAKETVSFKITSDWMATGLQGGRQHVDYFIAHVHIER